MKEDDDIKVFQTKDFSTENLICNGYNVCSWDLGETGKRTLWRHYFETAKSIIFVVDSTDKEKFPNIKTEIHDILDMQCLEKCTALILNNKTDLEGSVKADELEKELNLKTIKQKHTIIDTVATKGKGIQDGVKWIRESIKKK